MARLEYTHLALTAMWLGYKRNTPKVFVQGPRFSLVLAPASLGDQPDAATSTNTRYARRCLQAFSTTFLTSTSRLSRQFKRQFDAGQRRAGQRVWNSPDILPLSGWLMRTWSEDALDDPSGTLILLDSGQEEALWEDAIRATRADDPLLNVQQTAAAAAQAWDLLHRWEAPRDAAQFEGLQDTEAFFSWMKTVTSRLKENGWITRSELYAAVTTKLAQGHATAHRTYTAAGFEEAAPAERRLLRALRAKDQPIPASSNQTIRRFLLPDAAAEWAYAAEWARDTLAANPEARIGIAIPGLRHARAGVERVFDDALHPSYSFAPDNVRKAFEISAGGRLSEAPLIQTALGILALVDRLTLNEASSLLRSPLLSVPVEDRLKVEAELRRQGLDQVSIRLGTVRAIFPDLARAVDEIRSKQSPARWSSTFSNLLKAACWGDGEKLSDLEQHALRQWKDLLSRFARLGAVLPVMTLSEALGRVRHLTTSTFLDVADGDAPVHVVDLSELSGLRFDSLWVAGLDASTWPRSVRHNPFLSVRLQRELGMPRSSPEEEVARAHRVTSEWIQSARDVVFSSALRSREETLLVSPLIRDIQAEETNTPTDEARRVFATNLPLEVEPLGNGPALPRDVVHHGGTKILENLAACPFKAFATHRLGAQELWETPFGVSKMERGTTAHEALDQLWRTLKTKAALISSTKQELDSLITAAVDTALAKHLVRRQKSTGIDRFRDLEAVRLKRLLGGWLQVEAGRPAFTVVQTEITEEVSIGGMKLKVKADRIDRYDANGSHAILDYKTGKGELSTKKWEGDRLESPQLPVYAVTHEGMGVGEIAFAKLTPAKLGLIPEKFDGARLAEWRRVLETLADQYLSGYAAIDPKIPGKTCDLCALGPLCRVAEMNGKHGHEAGEGSAS
jgi:ATP-dependent helicase/nuclease subunit B